MKIFIGLVCFLSSGWALAASPKVMKVSSSQKFVAISQIESEPWKVDDDVCFYKKSKEVACGKISKSLKTSAVVEIKSASDKIDESCEIKSSSRKLASQVEESVQVGPKYRNEVGGGLIGAVSLYFPMISYQHGFGRHWALGVLPSFLNVSTSSTISLFSVAAMATFNYYFKEGYRGVWLQAGAGPHFYMIKSTSPAASENKMAFTGLATVGWKGSWDLGLNIGVAIGGIYISSPTVAKPVKAILFSEAAGLVDFIM
jgi:hypothetical protein